MSAQQEHELLILSSWKFRFLECTEPKVLIFIMDWTKEHELLILSSLNDFFF